MGLLQRLRSSRYRWLLAAALVILGGVIVYYLFFRAERVTVTVLETSDLHGNILSYDYLRAEEMEGGLARAASFVKAERMRDEELLLVDCGDALYGNMLTLLEDAGVEAMVQAMNLIGYDAWTLGNHEFQRDYSLLQRAVDLFDGDVLLGNAYHADGSYMDGARAYTIREVKGVKVGIFGIAPPHIPSWESSRPDRHDHMFFISPMEQTRIAVSLLRDKVDVLIGLVHYGPDGEYGEAGMREVARAYPQVDAFLLGHAHAVVNEKIGETVLLEPGGNGRYIAKLTVTLEKAGEEYRITGKTGENISMAGYQMDAEMEERCAALDARLKGLSNRIIGWADGVFLHGILPGKEVCGPLTSNFSRALAASKLPAAQLYDTALMDLVNDVQRYYTGADVSMAMLPSEEASIAPGPWRVRDVWRFYTGDGTLMAVEVSGAELREIMERYAGNYFSTYQSGAQSIYARPGLSLDRFCAFAGVEYEVDIGREYGQRIVGPMRNGLAVEDEEEILLALPKARYLELVQSGLTHDTALRFDAQADLPGAPSMRELIISYVEDVLNGQLSPSCDENWRLKAS